MPPSKLVPNLRFGWTAISSMDIQNGTMAGNELSNNADFEMDERLTERIALLRNGEIWDRTLLDGYPILRD